MTTFGSYIREKRTKAEIGLREAAEKIGIKPTYMSDIETGKRYPPDKDKLEKIVNLLNMDQKEADIMYDLAGKERNETPPDLVDYIATNEKVRETLRLARDKNIPNSDWDEIKNFIETI